MDCMPQNLPNLLCMKPNDFATFLMDQNSLPSLVVGAGNHQVEKSKVSEDMKSNDDADKAKAHLENPR